jgi:hypothetical protein
MHWPIWRKDRHLRQGEVSEYLDGRLSDRQVERIDAHLESCAACREEIESLRMTTQLLRRMPQREPGRSFVFVAPPEPAVAPRPRVPSWAYGAVASAFALAFAIVLSVDLSGLLVSSAPMGERQAQEVPSGAQGGAAADTGSERQVLEGTQELAPSKGLETEQAQPVFAPDPTPAPIPDGDHELARATDEDVTVTGGGTGQPEDAALEGAQVDEGGTWWVWHLVEGVLAAMAVVVAALFFLRGRLSLTSR